MLPLVIPAFPGRLLLTLALALSAASCGESPSPGSPVPSPPPVAPPSPAALTAAFVEDAPRVVEGEAAEITVRYEVRELAAATRLEVLVTETSVEADDYELGATGIEIPAGQGVSGTVPLSLNALRDGQISEGEETLSLRLSAPEGVAADLGPDLAVTIIEGGGNPCTGVTVLAEPPEPIAEGPPWTTVQVLGTTFRMDFLPEAAETTWDFVGPYRETPKQGVGFSPRWEGNGYHSMPEFAVVRWGTESTGAAIRHSIRVEWPADTDLALGFPSREYGCEGQPVVTCTGQECGLTR